MAATLSVDQALRKAKSFARKGAAGEAETLYRSVLDRFPDNRRAIEGLQALNRQGGAGPGQEQVDPAIALFNQGRMQEALSACRALLARHPHAAVLHNLAGSCLLALGKGEDAVASLRQALGLAPHSADIRANLAAALMMLHRLDEAKALLEQAVKINPDQARALSNLGSVFSELGRPAEAIAPLDKALSLAPTMAEAYNNRGNALNHLGRIEEAIADFEKAISLRPGFADAHRNLSSIKRFKPGDPQIAVIEQVLPDASPPDRMQLEFALAKACDDIGETDRAFEFYAAANAKRREQFDDPLAEQRKLFDMARTLFADGVPAPPDGLAPATKRPIFILGMPRSGTSLAEQILASHRDVHGAGELGSLQKAVIPALQAGELDEAAIREIRQSYLGSLDAFGFAEPVVTDKMPANFRWIGFIAAALPEATIIHMKRDPVAVGWSIFRTFFPAGGLEYSFDLADIAAYTELHDAMMGFWAERLPGRIHELDYDRLTENQEEETRRLLDLCRLGWDEHCLSFHETERTVTTASSAQVRQKLYSGSSQAWRKYAKHLGPLIEVLG